MGPVDDAIASLRAVAFAAVLGCSDQQIRETTIDASLATIRDATTVDVPDDSPIPTPLQRVPLQGNLTLGGGQVVSLGLQQTAGDSTVIVYAWGFSKGTIASIGDLVQRNIHSDGSVAVWSRYYADPVAGLSVVGGPSSGNEKWMFLSLEYAGRLDWSAGAQAPQSATGLIAATVSGTGGFVLSSVRCDSDRPFMDSDGAKIDELIGWNHFVAVAGTVDSNGVTWATSVDADDPTDPDEPGESNTCVAIIDRFVRVP